MVAGGVKGHARISRLQRRLDDVAVIDFFGAPMQKIAKALLNDLTACLSGHMKGTTDVKYEFDHLKEKIWVTRKNIFVDRIACAWLIQRFVDSAAVFKFVDSGTYASKQGEICFDMFDGEFTHRGDQCAFEVLIQDLKLQDRAVV